MRKSNFWSFLIICMLLSNAICAGELFSPFSEIGRIYFGIPHTKNIKQFGLISGRDQGGRFFSTADYAFTPGKQYALTGKKLFGISNFLSSGDLFVRGQEPLAVRSSYDTVLALNNEWLSNGKPCVCGITYDQAKPEQVTDCAVIYWGLMPPKPGEWGICIKDVNGCFKKVETDNQRVIYPYDQTTIHFAPTTVNTFYVGFKAKNSDNNFVSLRRIDLYKAEKRNLDNKLAIWQADAYWAYYETQKPGTITGVQLANYSLPGRHAFQAEVCALNNLAPFINVAGKRYYADNGEYPVQTKSDGRTQILEYDLKYLLPDKREATVGVKAVFGATLKKTISFEFKAGGLPEGAKLGFEMTGMPELFRNYCNADAKTVVYQIDSTGKTFDTYAGPFGLEVKGAKTFTLTDGLPVRFAMLADNDKLEVALSLPIGPLGGIQQDLVNYRWYPSLAAQGDPGLAPFNRDDLELIESVNLADPNDPHPVYDLSNDPYIAMCKKKGINVGMDYNNPEPAKVPLVDLLGSKCRVINNKDMTYFRFDLPKVRFEPEVPYLIVVEHAFDKERLGEFHFIGFDPDGEFSRSDHNLWFGPNPLGGCATGLPPYAKTFKKESTFYFSKGREGYGKDTAVSMCFSNRLSWQNATGMKDKDRPDGPAVKSVSIYRIRKMPKLPDIEKLLPSGARRHITVGTESHGSPWQLSEFPKLAGYNSIFVNHAMPQQLLYGGRKNYEVTTPATASNWHSNSLEAAGWLFAVAASSNISPKVFSQSLISYGFEGTDYNSFETAAGLFEGWDATTVPLSPTKAELAHLDVAFDKALAVIAPYKSFNDLSVVAGAQTFFTKRNFEDFTRETGISFSASPVVYENIHTLLASDQNTVDAWMKWSCQKRYEYLNWLLTKVRQYKPHAYLSINQNWYKDTLQMAYWGGTYPAAVYFDHAKLKARGINSYADFLRLVCYDPALYSGSDGFSFVVEKERKEALSGYTWPSPYDAQDFSRIRDGFGGGIAVSCPQYDECRKPLKGWTCTYVRDERSFRRDFVEGLLKANARDFFLDSYYVLPCDVQLASFRSFAIPFRLLPFVKPKEYPGKITDSAKQAVIKKYGDRYGLMNAGDLPTDAFVALPEGATTVIDLSSGVPQSLFVGKNSAGEIGVAIHLEQWTLKTLEIQ